MSSGFQSRALSLFTFIWSFTVSLGLRNMVRGVGETRMNCCRRVNIQHDQPRKDSQPPADAMSTRAKPTSKGDKETQQTKNFQIFTPFEKVVIEIRYKVACHKYIKWPKSNRTTKVPFPAIINTHTHTARFYDLDEARKVQYRENSKSHDIDDIKAMENKSRTPPTPSKNRRECLASTGTASKLTGQKFIA
ncbi:Fc.00g034280.m01.CDS01 [Cosmosporella sp. VM-42]